MAVSGQMLLTAQVTVTARPSQVPPASHSASTGGAYTSNDVNPPARAEQLDHEPERRVVLSRLLASRNPRRTYEGLIQDPAASGGTPPSGPRPRVQAGRAAPTTTELGLPMSTRTGRTAGGSLGDRVTCPRSTGCVRGARSLSLEAIASAVTWWSRSTSSPRQSIRRNASASARWRVAIGAYPFRVRGLLRGRATLDYEDHASRTLVEATVLRHQSTQTRQLNEPMALSRSRQRHATDLRAHQRSVIHTQRTFRSPSEIHANHSE